MVARLTMTLKYILLLLAVVSLNVNAKSSYKICVPAQFMKACEAMLEIPTKSKAILECVPARDRIECLSFVQQRQADLVPVDPEDMYVASKIPNQDFVVFQEYRTDEEPDAEFRYEAVIVVHKDLPINSLDQLKGLKSCHTGVNRNVGYKIPLTMLMKRAVFPKMTDRTISPKENELRALSTFFKKSCIVGQWSPDPKTNSAWKSQYSQLCSMCEHPEKCDYPDNYSGYEGALRCLAHNGGEVAFTKVIYVRKFFGLPVGTTPASQSSENPDEFAYLCVDGSKVSVREKPCSWAARPWQGLLGHNDVLAKLSPLREKIKQLADAGASTKPDWFINVLGLSEKIHHVADNIPIKPVDYLRKANYTEVIERGHGPPEPVVRLCVTSNVALSKCRAMSVFAFSRDIRPAIDCVRETDEQNCLRSVQDNGSDLAAVDDMDVASASKKYNLHPVFHEVYGEAKTPNYAVAVVKKNTPFNNIDDLRGKRSCHNSFGTFAGLAGPLYYLINKNKISSDQCIKNLANFFSGSCLPGVDKPENNPRGDDVSKLKKQCSSNNMENNAWKCLQEDRGDVAFVSSADLSNFDSAEYELLCLNQGHGRESLLNYTTCNIVMAPSRSWLSAKDFLSDVSIAHTPLSLAQLLDTRSDLFNIYGEFLKNNNVIFNVTAKGLATVEKVDFEKFKTIHDVMNTCGIA
ncbi:transferrin [Danaus plexippus plexippus]|uniref:Transferrin n=1 Tax=Danaus plexippus plexippus TaxID=278856 RepID=A0A212FLE3_DANPL|nr:transferrin-like [Danaus plexippus plexippus]OWR54552.1 transferrin [Danaus plexippus plexippus]